METGRVKGGTMGMPTRRTVLKGAAAVAGVAVVATPGLGSVAQAAPASARGGRPKANVLLVHGAWVDGSSWNAVTAILQRMGYTVLAVQLPLTSLADDVAWTRHVLAERLQGPVVLAGHSYGGAVISGAGTGMPNVIGLVYASAFAPDEGETLGGLNARFPAPPGLAFAQPDSLGFLWFDPAAVPTNFAQDIPVADARVLAAAQKPIGARCFADPAGPPAWKTLPSWSLVSTEDRMINPDLERFMAARAHSKTIEVRSSHASPASHPDTVAALSSRPPAPRIPRRPGSW
jgi:pimeloyl-ACP methyl ester carboxylesterase